MKENDDTNGVQNTAPQSTENQHKSIHTVTLVNIYNLLNTIEVKGESVKILAYIEQQLENILKC